MVDASKRELIQIGLCLLTLLAAPGAALELPVIVDTDAGSDDLMAISFLLARGDVHIEAITVVNGLAHVPKDGSEEHAQNGLAAGGGGLCATEELTRNP